MRQVIGSTWVLQLVIVFMLIFVGFLTLSINYTKAFKMKNEIITMLEKYEGAKDGENSSIGLVNNYLKYYNYSTMRGCETGEYGVANLDNPSVEPVISGKKYYYCIGKINASNSKFPQRARYEITIFFHFNLPVVGNLFTFTVSGTTIDINKPADRLSYTM